MTKSQKMRQDQEYRARMELTRIAREKELARKHRTFWQTTAALLAAWRAKG